MAPHPPLEGARPTCRDDGFTLLEVVVSFVLLVIVMTAAGSFMVRAVANTNGEHERQTAIALADQALDATRALTTPALVQGRTTALVTALRDAPHLVDLSPDDQTSTAALAATVDDSGAVATPTVPTTAVRTVGGVAYTVSTFLEACWMENGNTASSPVLSEARPCGPTQPSTRASLVYRITAEVSWRRGGATCTGPTSTTCAVDVSALRDATPRPRGYSDPVFAAAMSSPVLTGVGPAGPYPAGTATRLTLVGSGFASGGQVVATGAARLTGTSVSSPMSVTVTLMASTPPGTYQLQVVNLDGGITRPLTVVVQ